MIPKSDFPSEWVKLKNHYLDYHRNTLRHKKKTLESYATKINCLYRFMLENKIRGLVDLTQKDIIKFQHYIYRQYHISTFRSIEFLLLILRAFCRYLHHNNLIWKNPFNEIKYIQPHEYEGFELKRYYNFSELITRWTNWMKKRQFHIQNVKDKLDSLRLFILFLSQKGIKTIYKVDPSTMDEYKNFLLGYQYQPGCYYSPLSQIRNLHHVCQFLIYLHREGLIKQDVTRYMNLRGYSKELDNKYHRSISFNPKKHTGPRIPNPEIQDLLDKFIQYHLSNGGSKEGVRNYLLGVEKFYSFITERGITDLKKVTKRDIIDYTIWLGSRLNSKGIKYAPNTIHHFIVNLRSFFRFLVKYDYLICDPCSSVDIPKPEKAIPRTCMTEREVELFLNAPNTNDPIGLRDKAILEVFYSTGLRANELANLSIQDVDFSQGLLKVEHPKGGKSYQRIIPIGKVACEYTKMYLEKVRPLYNHSNDGYLFLSRTGKKLVKSYLSCMVRKYLFHCGLRKKITTHSFRVTCATHMLTHGADIRYVQQQLGHISIRTTQGYTRLIPKDLKAVHSRCHPREKRIEKST